MYGEEEVLSVLQLNRGNVIVRQFNQVFNDSFISALYIYLCLCLLRPSCRIRNSSADLKFEFFRFRLWACCNNPILECMFNRFTCIDELPLQNFVCVGGEVSVWLLGWCAGAERRVVGGKRVSFGGWFAQSMKSETSVFGCIPEKHAVQRFAVVVAPCRCTNNIKRHRLFWTALVRNAFGT